MKKIIVLIVLVAILVGCGSPTDKSNADVKELPPLDYCEIDDDCTCGGIDLRDGRCFIGNKLYYENYVDKKKECPDFCTGIDGNLKVRCVDSKCIQMYGCLVDADCDTGQRCKNNKCLGKIIEGGCRSDVDCVTGGCSGTICQSKSDEPVFTTCEYKDEYECFKTIDCGCVDGSCSWEETAEFDSCVETRKQGPE